MDSRIRRPPIWSDPPKNRFARPARRLAFWGMLVAVASGGCGYTLSSALPSHIKSLAIPTLTNNTVEFGLADDITQALVSGFFADQHLRLVQERDADAILRGTILEYTNRVFGYTSAERATEYEVILVVNVAFRDMRKNRDLWKEDRLIVRTTYNVVPVGAEPAKTEADGRRDVIQKLTDRIVSRTVQGW